jgi:predicted amidohydrolase
MSGSAWDMLLPARAFENEVYLMACAQAGTGYYGHSKVLDYTGTVLTQFDKEEGLKIAEIDLEKQKKWRKIITFFEDRRPELYE